jgi:hypothetical protein
MALSVAGNVRRRYNINNSESDFSSVRHDYQQILKISLLMDNFIIQQRIVLK